MIITLILILKILCILLRIRIRIQSNLILLNLSLLRIRIRSNLILLRLNIYRIKIKLKTMLLLDIHKLKNNIHLRRILNQTHRHKIMLLPQIRLSLSLIHRLRFTAQSPPPQLPLHHHSSRRLLRPAALNQNLIPQ